MLLFRLTGLLCIFVVYIFLILLYSSFFSPCIPSVVAQTQTCQGDVDMHSQEKEGVGMREVDDGKILRDVIRRTLKDSLLELMEEEEMMVERKD